MINVRFGSLIGFVLCNKLDSSEIFFLWRDLRNTEEKLIVQFSIDCSIHVESTAFYGLRAVEGCRFNVNVVINVREKLIRSSKPKLMNLSLQTTNSLVQTML